jgi:hypothetical protein
VWPREVAEVGVRREVFVAVCFEGGGAAVYDASLLTAGRRCEDGRGEVLLGKRWHHVPAAVGYPGGRYHILAVSHMVYVPGMPEAMAIALAVEDGVHVAEDVVGDSEETRSPQSLCSGRVLPPVLTWALVSGSGTSGSCVAVAPVSGIGGRLAAEDFPLVCTSTGSGRVSVVTSRGRALVLDPATQPVDCLVRAFEAAPLDGTGDHQRVVAAACSDPAGDFALMFPVPGSDGDADGEDLFELNLQIYQASSCLDAKN